MSFIKKTWLARIGVGLNRFRMNNSTDVVLESNPVSVTQQGDQLSADNMNNLETRIGNAFDEMAGNLAPIEVSPASTNHVVGTQIVYNGILYKVTSAISTDDNLVVGTNISPYPVSSAISDISVQLLWTNPNPLSSFPAQTISFPNTKQFMFFIIISSSYGAEGSQDDSINFVSVGNAGQLQKVNDYVNVSSARRINSSTDTSIEFAGGKLNSVTALTSDDKRQIPHYVYGWIVK